MGEVVDLSSRRAAPVWGGQVELFPNPVGGVEAVVSAFYGTDNREPAERLNAWAHALERLALEMRATATAIGDR